MFSTTFLLTALVVALIPGTGAIYTVSTGLFRGRQASIAAALGIIPHLLASILGLSFILHMSAVVFQGIKFAGAVYLLYLAWATWNERSELEFNATSTEAGSWQIIVKAVLLNLLNPKLTLFFLAFLPHFVTSGSASPIPQFLGLSLVFMAVTFLVFAVYGLLANGIRKYIVNSPRILIWLRRSFAVVFAGLSVELALTDH